MTKTKIIAYGLAVMVLSWMCVELATAQVGNVVTSGHQYYVDPGETDQGVAGNGKSIAAWLAAIGTSKHAELILEHKIIADNTTSYTVSTAINMTSYPKVHLVFKPGALLAGTENVILPAPGNIKASPMQQIFSGSGIKTFSGPGTVFPDWWGVDGTADNVQATAAYNSLTAGGTVVFQGPAYSFAENATIQSNIVTEIKPWTTITLAATASGTSLLYGLNESNIQIIGGGTLHGNRANVTGGDYAHGIFLNTCSNVTIRDIKITDAYKDNIYLTGCTNVRIYDCNIEESAGNGIYLISNNNVKIKGCYFDDNLNTAGTADLLIYTGNVDVSVSENTFREGGAQITGQSHAIYSIGSTGVRISGNYAENKYGYAVELQQAATDEGVILVGNYFKNCGNETDQTGGLYVSGENNLLVGNFVTGSAIDAMTMTSGEGNVIAGNILTNSGDADTDGYGIRFTGAASIKTIISSNAIRDTQDTKTMLNALYLSANPAIVVGNLLYETEDGYPYMDSADQDHVFSANLYGVRSAGYQQGDRVRKAQYVGDLLGNATFDRNNFSVFLVGASGANRNLNPAGEWYAGDDVWIKNTGGSNDIVFDSSGLNQSITPGQIGYFVYNGLTSLWVKLYLGS